MFPKWVIGYTGIWMQYREWKIQAIHLTWHLIVTDRHSFLVFVECCSKVSLDHTVDKINLPGPSCPEYLPHYSELNLLREKWQWPRNVWKWNGQNIFSWHMDETNPHVKDYPRTDGESHLHVGGKQLNTVLTEIHNGFNPHIIGKGSDQNKVCCLGT